MKKFLIALLSVMMLFAVMGCKDDEEGGGGNNGGVVTPTATCACADCALVGKSAAEATGLFCDCEAGDPCTHSCSICTPRPAVYLKLTGDRNVIDRTTLTSNQTIVYGQDFSTVVGDLKANGSASGGKAPGGFAFATGTAGGKQGTLTALPAGKVTFDDDAAMYKIIINGRVSAALPNGRVEIFESPLTNGATLTTLAYTATFILTRANITDGVVVHLNQWNDNAGEEVGKVVSVDDVVVYKEPAPEITNFNLPINAPAAGNTPPTTVENNQITGVITGWTPELPADGKYAINVQYVATIVITAKPGFQIVSLNEDQVFNMVITSGNIASTAYNKNTKTITTGQFPATVQAAPEFTVNFSTANVVAMGVADGCVISDVTAESYSIQYLQYDGAAAKFNVTIPPGFTLADYSSVTVTVSLADGNSYGKPMRLHGATVAGGGLTSVASTGAQMLSNAGNIGANPGDSKEMTFTLNPATAASIEGAAEFAITVHASSTDGGDTVYTFSNLTFHP